MGWWGEDIMGGDTPLDVKLMWKEKFHNSTVSSNEASQFFEEINEKWDGCDEDIVKQVVGYLMLKSKFHISFQLKQIILQAIENEMNDSKFHEIWNEPEKRITHLKNFKKQLIQ